MLKKEGSNREGWRSIDVKIMDRDDNIVNYFSGIAPPAAMTPFPHSQPGSR